MERKRRAANAAVFGTYVALALLNALYYLDVFKVSDNSAGRIFTVLSQIVCMGIIPTAIFFALKGTSGTEGFKDIISLKKPVKGTGGSIALVAVMMVFINLLVAVLFFIVVTAFGFKPVNSAGTIYTGVGILILDLVMTALLPSIFEELTFRGIVLGAYRDNPWLAVFISAALFALMHTNILQVFYTFIGGLVMGYIVIKTRSIVASAVMHFAINAFSVLRSYGAQHPKGVIGLIFEVFEYFLSGGLIFFFAAVFGMIAAVVYILKRIDKSDPVNMRGSAGKPSPKVYASLLGAAVFGVLMTFFTFIWGVVR